MNHATPSARRTSRAATPKKEQTLREALTERAQALITEGFNLIPIKPSGLKDPAMPKGYIEKNQPLKDTETALKKVDMGQVDGFGVVTGPASFHEWEGSGHVLLALELEGRAVNPNFLADWRNAAEHVQAAEILERLDRGWVETTPSGGERWFFRVPALTREVAEHCLSAKTLACIAAKRDEGGVVETFAEILVTKHQTICAPSGGRTHKSGKSWEIKCAGKIPVLSVADVYALGDLLASVNEVGSGSGKSALETATGRTRQVAASINRRAKDVDTINLLLDNGWRVIETDPSGATHMEAIDNPGHGRVKVGGSYYPGGRLWTFSTSTPFPDDTIVTHFEVRAILDKDAPGDVETLADRLLKSGEAQVSPWPLSSKGRLEVMPDATATDVLAMRLRRRLADAVHPRMDLPFVMAHVSSTGEDSMESLVSFFSVEREGGIRRWPANAYRNLLLAVVQPIRVGKKGDTTMLHDFADGVVKTALPSGEVPPGVTTVRYIAEQPILLPDGTVLDKPGLYRAKQALVGIPAKAAAFWKRYRVPETITAADAQAAYDWLDHNFLHDFPFATTGDRVRAMSYILTAATRDLYGAAPAFGFDAADRGTGKTLLATAGRLAGTGTTRAQSVSPKLTDDAETGKNLVTAAQAGIPAIHIDELMRGQQITSRMLSEFITADGTMSLRILGGNSHMLIPGMLVSVCGCNMEVGADMQRRFIPVRMVHTGDNLAFERDGFLHTDLLRWIRENRAEILAKIHTVVAYGLRQNTPSTALPSGFGSFEGWRDVVLGALHHITVAGPKVPRGRIESMPASKWVVDGRKEFIDTNDEEGDEWLPFMRAWEQRFPDGAQARAGDAHAQISAMNPPVDLPRELLGVFGQTTSGIKKSWGRALQRRRDTAVRADDRIYRLRCIPDSKRGNRYWMEIEQSTDPKPDPSTTPPAATEVQAAVIDIPAQRQPDASEIVGFTPLWGDPNEVECA